MDTKMLILHALSPLHAGTGQGIGVIDLPIAREKATNIPYLPGSTIKGVLRDACEETKRDGLFGKAEAGGSLSFTDARLLLMPVRSLSGVFAWVTSPLLLQRFLRDTQSVSGSDFPKLIPAPAATAKQEDAEECLLPAETSELTLEYGQQKQVILEDLVFISKPSPELSAWATALGGAIFPNDENWRQHFIARFCLISDDALSFLLETGTQITARIRLEDQKKTTVQGALWYEEALPAETVLSGLVITSAKDGANAFKALSAITSQTLQLGGNATVGAGLCKLHIV